MLIPGANSEIVADANLHCIAQAAPPLPSPPLPEGLSEREGGRVKNSSPESPVRVRAAAFLFISRDCIASDTVVWPTLAAEISCPLLPRGCFRDLSVVDLSIRPLRATLDALDPRASSASARPRSQAHRFPHPGIENFHQPLLSSFSFLILSPLIRPYCSRQIAESSGQIEIRARRQ